MAIFNFLENFFFISLAITFGLLLLLVYHFKERITLVEKKSDTMNEIVTNIVKEIKNIRMALHSHPIQQPQPSYVAPILQQQQPVVPNRVEYKIQELNSVHDDSSDDESSVESDDSSDDESSNDESSNDKTSDDESSDDESSIAESDVELSVNNDLEQTNKLDISEDLDVDVDVDIDLHISEDLGVLNSDNLLPEKQMDEVVLPERQMDEIVLPERQMDEVLMPEKQMDNVMEIDLSFEKIVDQEQKDPKREVYRKMNINQLRTIATSAGLSQDTSKMKKNELIKLLESLDDE
jgi:hypothetical protein